MSLVHEANSLGPPSGTDLDVIPHLWPTLGAVQVTDVMQTLFPELKAVRDIEAIRTIFPELKVIQVNELGPAIP
jgi:hypothetical protein